MRTAIKNSVEDDDDSSSSTEMEMDHETTNDETDEEEEEQQENRTANNTASITRTVQSNKNNRNNNDPNARITPSPTLDAAAAADDDDGGEESEDEDEPTDDPDQPSAAEATARRLAEEEALLLAEKAKDATQLELDKIFDEQQEHKFDNVPAFEMPRGFRSTVSLFPYQQDGVRWMKHQETAAGDRVPPFYKAIRLGVSRDNEWWNCSLTNKKTKDTPVSPSSSILADDMGLGKTTISCKLFKLGVITHSSLTVQARHSIGR